VARAGSDAIGRAELRAEVEGSPGEPGAERDNGDTDGDGGAYGIT
jgi:hypothetical protein